MSVDVVVCNLTRFGDLVQSQALIDDLHQAGHRVGLVCLENFASAIPLLRNVEKSWHLRGGRLMSRLDKFWPLATNEILSFVSQVRGEGKAKYILNLTPSLPARLLAKMLANSSSEMLGFGMDEFGFALNQGVWASFLAIAAQKRLNSPFNIADLFRMLGISLSGGLRGSFRLAHPSPQSVAWAKNFLAEADPKNPPAGHVAFQLGASEDRRRWPVGNFRELGKRVWEATGFIPVLTGSHSENHLAEKYAREADHPFINAIGKTDLPQLAALLRETKLLVTNDTGTMHLASGQGVPSVSFFLATAQPWDTGPLMPGSICLEPALDCHPCAFGRPCGRQNACRSLITPAGVFSLVQAKLLGHDWMPDCKHPLVQQARVWLTEVEVNGMTRVAPLCTRHSERDLWLAKLRVFWRQLLDDMEGQNNTAPTKSSPASAAQEEALRDVAKQAVPCLENVGELLDSLRALGPLASKNPRIGKLFMETTEKLQNTLDNCQPLASLALFWRELRESQGDSLEKFIPAATKFGDHCQILANDLSVNLA